MGTYLEYMPPRTFCDKIKVSWLVPGVQVFSGRQQRNSITALNVPVAVLARWRRQSGLVNATAGWSTDPVTDQTGPKPSTFARDTP